MILQPQVVCGLPGQKGSWGWVGGNRFTGRDDGLRKTLLEAGVGKLDHRGAPKVATSIPPGPKIKPNPQVCLEHSSKKKITACLEICNSLPSSKG